MEDILMSKREAERYRIMKAVMEKEIDLKKASELMEVCYRQSLRIKADFKEKGLPGLISKKRGEKSNRAISEELEAEIIRIIRNHYTGNYGPTLISEKLEDKHTIVVSKEKVRKLLIKHEIPYPTRKRKNRAHQRRRRKDCRGELEQTDASIHHWFGEELPRCALHLSVDDAIGSLIQHWRHHLYIFQRSLSWNWFLHLYGYFSPFFFALASVYNRCFFHFSFF